MLPERSKNQVGVMARLWILDNINFKSSKRDENSRKFPRKYWELFLLIKHAFLLLKPIFRPRRSVADNIIIFKAESRMTSIAFKRQMHFDTYRLHICENKIRKCVQNNPRRGSQTSHHPCYLPLGLCRADNTPSTTNGKPTMYRLDSL